MDIPFPITVTKDVDSSLRTIEKCSCGQVMGSRVVVYRDGPYWALQLPGFPKPILSIETNCPCCGKPWFYHSKRKAKARM